MLDSHSRDSPTTTLPCLLCSDGLLPRSSTGTTAGFPCHTMTKSSHIRPKRCSRSAWHLGGTSATPCSSFRLQGDEVPLSLFCLLLRSPSSPPVFPGSPVMVDASRSHSNLIGPCHVLSPLVALSARLQGCIGWLAWQHGSMAGRVAARARPGLAPSHPPTAVCVGSASSSASIDLPPRAWPLFVQLLLHPSSASC